MGFQVQPTMCSIKCMRIVLLGAMMSFLAFAAENRSIATQLRGQSAAVPAVMEGRNNETLTTQSRCCKWPFECNGCAQGYPDEESNAQACRNQHVLCMACDCDCCARYYGR